MLGTAAPPAVCHQCSSRRGGSVEPSGGEDLGREVPQHLQLAVVWNGQFFLSWDIYIYVYIYIQCSRIELKKMSNKSRQLQQHIIFCYAAGLCGWVSV